MAASSVVQETANWLPHLLPLTGWDLPLWLLQPWPVIAGTFAAVVLSVFLVEMATFRAPGTSVTRMALTVWTIAYLGLLPSFLAQLRFDSRWLPPMGIVQMGTVAVALAIFVPKFCDIGAGNRLKIDIERHAIAQRRGGPLIIEPLVEGNQAKGRCNPLRQTVALDDEFAAVQDGIQMRDRRGRQPFSHCREQNAAIDFGQQPTLDQRPPRLQRCSIPACRPGWPRARRSKGLEICRCRWRGVRLC